MDLQLPLMLQHHSRLPSAAEWKDRTSKLHATGQGPGLTSCPVQTPALSLSPHSLTPFPKPVNSLAVEDQFSTFYWSPENPTSAMPLF